MTTTTDRAALIEKIAAEMLTAARASEPASEEALREAALTELLEDARWANEQARKAEARGWTQWAEMYRRQESQAIDSFMALGRTAQA